MFFYSHALCLIRNNFLIKCETEVDKFLSSILHSMLTLDSAMPIGPIQLDSLQSNRGFFLYMGHARECQSVPRYFISKSGTKIMERSPVLNIRTVYRN